MEDVADVVVVGAGPAGSSAAHALAARGWDVRIIDRREFPRDKSCGDALSPLAVDELDRMDVLDRLDGQQIRGARIVHPGAGTRELRYRGDRTARGGMVVPRVQLDAQLREAALVAGARPLTGAVVDLDARDGRRRVRLTADLGGTTGQLTLGARVVVGADGATSLVARRAGLRRANGWHRGLALRTYFDDIGGLDDELDFYVPLHAAGQGLRLPAYGWMFPTGPSSANVGVGVMFWEQRQLLWAVWDEFVTSLRSDPRFRDAEPRGRPDAAPLQFDFDASRCVGEGIVLVGEAAGLVSPFTGEGIGLALESGRLAATTIDSYLRGDTDALSDYADVVESRYGGFFEMGRYTAKRYQLCWNLLDSSLQSERPLFRHYRNAVLHRETFGKDVSDVSSESVADIQSGLRLRLGTDLAAVGGMIVDCVRQEWPAIASYLSDNIDNADIRLRPAMFTLLASYSDQSQEEGDRTDTCRVAAAIELGHMAALCHLSLDDVDVQRPGIHWGNTLAILLGDYLVCEAMRLTVAIDARKVARSLIAELTGLSARLINAVRSRQEAIPSPSLYEEQLLECWGAVFAFGLKAGAELGRRHDAEVAALERYGQHVGVATRLSDEVLAIVQRTPEPSNIAGLDTGDPLLGLPALCAIDEEPDLGPLLREHWSRRQWLATDQREELRRSILRAGYVSPALAACRRHAETAVAALGEVRPGRVRTTLEKVAYHVVTRANQFGEHASAQID